MTAYSYSWSKFGREAEYVTALYLKSAGWNVWLSKGSKGPADIVAIRDSSAGSDVGGSNHYFQQWFIQVKASNTAAHLKGYEVKRLKELAQSKGGLPVVATLQPNNSSGKNNKDKTNTIIIGASPSDTSFDTGNYSILFYMVDSWQLLNPKTT